MTFRTRLQLATVLAALIPLTVLAFGVRREMDRRLTEESRRRGEAAVQALGTELRQEHDRLAARLGALAEELAADNRLRLAAVQGDARSRAYILDWAGIAMRIAGRLPSSRPAPAPSCTTGMTLSPVRSPSGWWPSPTTRQRRRAASRRGCWPDRSGRASPGHSSWVCHGWRWSPVVRRVGPRARRWSR